MKKNILSLAALLIASATFVACSSDDNIIDEQPAKPQVYTMTVNAQKGGDAAATRALALDGKTLNAMWATSENVYVKKGDTWVGGSLQPDADAATATLKGELSGVDIAAGDELTLQFPKSGDISYAGQVGTLEDIAANFDYATATVTVASVSGGKITTTADASFTNQQAIVKFTLIDKADGTTPLSASELTVSDGTNTYTVTPASATSEIYVAIPGFTGKTVTLTATVGIRTYTYEKTGVTFNNGQYYEITVKMTKEASANVSKLSADYEVQDGETLKGYLYINNQPYEISIADGATVTLKDLTFDGYWSDRSCAGLTCKGNATIILSGKKNRVMGLYSNYPGIFVPEGCTLTIKGDGSLTVEGNDNAPGIGNIYGGTCGNIVIEGGTITAKGGNAAPGIGSCGYDGTCGDITVTGGKVTAMSTSAPGIGSFEEAECGNITITNTVTMVTVVLENGSISIGKGGRSCGTVTIGGTVYYDGENYQNDGETYLATSPLVYKP